MEVATMKYCAEKHVRPMVEWPPYWFLLLDHYLADGNLDAAAEARRQLERLGVQVRYCTQARTRPEAANLE
jgi:hypothetical protein